jgi:hypothetical protein
MGNGDNCSGDGWKYRGRGFIQLTGKSNYAEASRAIYGDDRLVKDPDLVLQPHVAAEVTAWYMKKSQGSMAKGMGIDINNMSQDQANLLATSQVAGQDVRKAGGYLAGENLDKVNRYAAQQLKTTKPAAEQKTAPAPGFEFTFFHFIGCVTLVGSALLFFMLKRNQSDVSEAIITEIKPEKKEFSVNDMQQFITNKEVFYQEMELKMNAFLLYKFGLEKADLNKENIIQKFRENHISQETTNDFVKLLQNCEKARYMPTTDGNMQMDFEKLQQLVQIINE